MSTVLYEIMMLSDGEVVLQRNDQQGEPLVRISFSEEAKRFLQDTRMTVAHAMIDAGIQAVEALSAEGSLDVGVEVQKPASGSRVLH